MIGLQAVLNKTMKLLLQFLRDLFSCPLGWQDETTQTFKFGKEP
jgi:hypothetical protein